MADINLIPQEVKKEQTKKQVVKSTTIVSIVLLILVSMISTFLLVRYFNAKSQISATELNIEELRFSIRGLSQFEIIARTLDQKYQTVKSVLGMRGRYSVLMAEFKKRIPSTVTIDTFGTGKDGTINVSGTGLDYIAIAQFVNNLANMSFEGASRGYERLFTEVSLNSVNLDAQTSRARFFIVITLDQELLRK